MSKKNSAPEPVDARIVQQAEQALQGLMEKYDLQEYEIVKGFFANEVRMSLVFAKRPPKKKVQEEE